MEATYEEIVEHFKTNTVGPEGTIEFVYQSRDLFDKTSPIGIIFDIASGKHVFRLERDENYNLNYYYSSPGSSTRVATLNLNDIKASNNTFICLTWSPDETNMSVGSLLKDEKLVDVKGKPSEIKLYVGEDGNIYHFGGQGIKTMGVNFYQGGKPILQPTALEAWEQTIHAIDMLATGHSDKGYAYEVVVTNVTLSVLVTGLEAYTKKRFLELEKEGITPNMDKLISSFYSKKERDANLYTILQEEAIEKGITELQHVVSNKRRINFQDFKQCSLAYSKGYNIKFNEIGISTETLEDLKKFIKYRHKIIHVSATLGILNQERVPSEEPIFSSTETAKKAEKCFIEFIDKLHQATLKLRKHD